ncbi:MAG: peptidase inhibitor I78 [Caulobacterales bacterium]|nr:peptidase inhibitor I78 [Caulobacterales bacterium]
MKQLTFLTVIGLGACAAAPPATPVATTPAPVTAAPTFPLPPPPPPDSCGAAAMQWLVGQPRSKIPIPTDPSRRRVACTTCPVTMDYSPVRLNIFFDAETGIVKEVKCG